MHEREQKTKHGFVQILIVEFFNAVMMDPDTCVVGVGDCADLGGGWGLGGKSEDLQASETKTRGGCVVGPNQARPSCGATHDRTCWSGKICDASPSMALRAPRCKFLCEGAEEGWRAHHQNGKVWCHPRIGIACPRQPGPTPVRVDLHRCPLAIKGSRHAKLVLENGTK